MGYDESKHPRNPKGQFADKPKAGVGIPRAGGGADDSAGVPEWCEPGDEAVRTLLTKPSDELTPEERSTLLDVTYSWREDDGYWEEDDSTDTVADVRDMIAMYADGGHEGFFDEMHVRPHVDWESTLSPDSLAALRGGEPSTSPLDDLEGFIAQYGLSDRSPVGEPPTLGGHPTDGRETRMAGLHEAGRSGMTERSHHGL